MYKIITVHDCAECPYRSWRSVYHSSINYCGKSRYINNNVGAGNIQQCQTGRENIKDQAAYQQIH